MEFVIITIVVLGFLAVLMFLIPNYPKKTTKLLSEINQRLYKIETHIYNQTKKEPPK